MLNLENYDGKLANIIQQKKEILIKDYKEYSDLINRDDLIEQIDIKHRDKMKMDFNRRRQIGS